METTLLLNIGYEPLRIIPWQRAITLFFLGKVEVVEEYDRHIRSVSVSIKVPAVVRLVRYVRLVASRPPLTKPNLLARDKFECQYCGCGLTLNDSTMDHIVPRSQGGERSWINVVAACNGCNRRKGGRTPQEARMILRRNPFEPQWLPVLTVCFESQVPHAWLVFLRAKEI